MQLEYRILVHTTIDKAFEALQNPKTWPQWFPGMTHASEMDRQEAYPARTVTLNYTIRFREEFITWEPPSKIAYRVSAVSIPYAKELVEEFTLRAKEQGTEITYRIGMEVHHSLRLVSGLVSKIGARSYAQALKNLKNFLET